MEVQQATEAANRAKPVKPQARPVKKKESVKESMQEATSELTSENHPVQAIVQDCVGAGNGKVIGNEEFENEGRVMKKKKKANPTISREAVSAATRQIHQVQAPDSNKKGNVNLSVICLLTIMLLMLTESTLHFMNITWGLRNKKYGLLCKVHNWHAHLEPELKGAAKPSPVPSVPTETVFTNSLGISSARTGQTVMTTVSLAKDPPPSLTDSCRTSHIPASDEDGDVNIDIDIDADNNEDNEEFEEHLSSLIANGKGRGGGCRVSVVITNEITELSDDDTSKRLSVSTPFNLLQFTQQAEIVRFTIEQVQSTHTTAADDSIILDTSEFMTPKVKPIPTELAQITSKTSVTITSILASPEPDLMSADMMMKPKSGNQWRNTNLPQIMLEDGMWRRPTNYFQRSKDKDNDINFEQTLAANLLDEWAFLYNNPDMIKSTHMNAIAGFLDVPMLNTDDLQLKARTHSQLYQQSPKLPAMTKASALAVQRAVLPRVAEYYPSSTTNPVAKTALLHQHFQRQIVDWRTAEYYQSLKRQGTKYMMDTISLVCQCQEVIRKLKNAPAEDPKPKAGCALLCIYFPLVMCSATTTDASDTGRIPIVVPPLQSFKPSF
ncbi:uncharacterized protein EDB91DRAFT_1251008 [Suillus paluster]|uniref:uncharacterized protein n=1 Tax=Suillus paluster TaxID=48578 RepID=UPI001B87ED73|nr:uncharacterized protein EDB91DRAFT_1251008 [Suillus paluster]KAG1734223.1 hypothetical protein EDB91DRAFT_1251008 [Suillus paluster]